jgi:hypothetical protein
MLLTLAPQLKKVKSYNGWDKNGANIISNVWVTLIFPTSSPTIEPLNEIKVRPSNAYMCILVEA